MYGAMKTKQTFWAVVSKRTGKVVISTGIPQIFQAKGEAESNCRRFFTKTLIVKKVVVEVVG